ncbi:MULTISPECIES: hypothetical protein [unclassified Modestobacter]|uniref:hypothetical protein n=1 Tax=unclassified Modestobacter TaxID=2643866 RepID=UPI0022AB30D1|nr:MULTISPECIES: hypothetical protein [unclassified Modestobacter]MCZ2811625.1 hypothetical protein [Modestobacter sp. VKM Ac-2979]MCZ2843348.1 hypothetical protein [Modestobacter sp. VKM Ac-2980]MCZ2848687.1 hypothetical protein [Modestobacter sp. VKM Ac-2978]
MSLFRRGMKPSAPVESSLHAWPQVERAPVKYEGVARSSLDHPDFRPYEFQTEGGIWVRLHEMQFAGFDYRVQQPTLTMRFVYDDPEWTPVEARATPVAVFRFTDVQVWQWEDDYDLVETPADVRGQVRQLDYHPPTNVFSLLTVNTSLLFSAAQLTVELQQRTGM